VIHTVQQGTRRLRVSLLENRNFKDGSDCASLSGVFTFSSSFFLIQSSFYLLIEDVEGTIFAPDHTQ